MPVVGAELGIVVLKAPKLVFHQEGALKGSQVEQAQFVAAAEVCGFASVAVEAEPAVIAQIGRVLLFGSGAVGGNGEPVLVSVYRLVEENGFIVLEPVSFHNAAFGPCGQLLHEFAFDIGHKQFTAGDKSQFFAVGGYVEGRDVAGGFEILCLCQGEVSGYANVHPVCFAGFDVVAVYLVIALKDDRAAVGAYVEVADRRFEIGQAHFFALPEGVEVVLSIVFIRQEIHMALPVDDRVEIFADVIGMHFKVAGFGVPGFDVGIVSAFVAFAMGHALAFQAFVEVNLAGLRVYGRVVDGIEKIAEKPQGRTA